MPFPDEIVKASGSRSFLSIAIRNMATVLIVFLTAVGFFYVSANLPSEAPRVAIKEAFADGTLNYDTYRLLEAVPGFIVMESDSSGSCYVYGHMLAPSESLFGLGARSADTSLMNCEALDAVVQEPDSPVIYISYYRYWQGVAAVSKVALSVLSVAQYQLAISIILLVLCGIISWLAWRRSRILGLGFIVTFTMTSDFLWQGFSPLHGVSSVGGLAGSLIAYIAFKRSWGTRWGWLVASGLIYAMLAHTLIPMAFVLLAYMLVFLPTTTIPQQTSTIRLMIHHLGIPLVWLVGYGVGSVSRWIWAITAGPGMSTLQGEFSYASEKFVTTSLIDPPYQVVGLLTKTWLEIGVMQIGLMVMTLLIGASVGAQLRHGLQWRSTGILVTPLVYPISWISVFAFHTNHTYVHAVLALMLLLVLYSFEIPRPHSQPEVSSEPGSPSIAPINTR